MTSPGPRLLSRPLLLSRRGLLAAALALPAIRTRAATSQTTLLVGAAAGSSADQGARAFAPFLERHLPGTTVAVVNHPGEGSLLAFEAIAAAAGDGAVLGWVATPVLPARTIDRAGAAGLIGKLRLIASVQKEPIAFVSDASNSLTSAQELITRSSENAAAVPLGTPPAGSPPHLAALRLQALSGTKLNLVAFPSAAAARQAALAGTVSAAALGLGDAISCLRSARLTGLGLAAGDRSEAFPDMPVLGEFGLMLSAPIHRGLAGPAALSDADAARLSMALEAVVADPEFAAQGEDSGFHASLLPGVSWTEQALAERAELAGLWQAEPWLGSGVG